MLIIVAVLAIAGSLLVLFCAFELARRADEAAEREATDLAARARSAARRNLACSFLLAVLLGSMAPAHAKPEAVDGAECVRLAGIALLAALARDAGTPMAVQLKTARGELGRSLTAPERRAISYAYDNPGDAPPVTKAYVDGYCQGLRDARAKR